MSSSADSGGKSSRSPISLGFLGVYLASASGLGEAHTGRIGKRLFSSGAWVTFPIARVESKWPTQGLRLCWTRSAEDFIWSAWQIFGSKSKPAEWAVPGHRDGLSQTMCDRCHLCHLLLPWLPSPAQGRSRVGLIPLPSRIVFLGSARGHDVADTVSVCRCKPTDQREPPSPCGSTSGTTETACEPTGWAPPAVAAYVLHMNTVRASGMFPRSSRPGTRPSQLPCTGQPITRGSPRPCFPSPPSRTGPTAARRVGTTSFRDQGPSRGPCPSRRRHPRRLAGPQRGPRRGAALPPRTPPRRPSTRPPSA